MRNHADVETEEMRYRRLARPMWAMLYAQYCDADLALDAVQEAFLRWRELQPTDVDQPDSWLLRVASNWMTDQLRRRQRRPYTELQDYPADDPTPDGALMHSEHRAAIRRALSDLKMEDREILVLRYALDWTAKRIGEAIGLSAAAVEMRMTRARRQLAELLLERGVVESHAAT